MTTIPVVPLLPITSVTVGATTTTAIPGGTSYTTAITLIFTNGVKLIRTQNTQVTNNGNNIVGSATSEYFNAKGQQAQTVTSAASAQITSIVSGKVTSSCTAQVNGKSSGAAVVAYKPVAPSPFASLTGHALATKMLQYRRMM